jgi:phosphomannomutase
MGVTEMPIMSVSGVRGKYGESIDESFVSRMACVHTCVVGAAGGGKMVIGRDTRPTGETLMRAAARGIMAAGGVPVDIGIAPTPTTCVAVGESGAAGGIVITASHNPLPYNGYKMVHRSGRLLREEECEAVYAEFRGGNCPDDGDMPAFAAESADAAAVHIDKILKYVDAGLIRSKNIKIAVDSINGAAGAVFPLLLERLGVRWEGVHNKLDGDFVHNPEPRPEHLGDLRRLLLSDAGFWGGFVFDPDADRLAVMGEAGQEVSEEMTLALALQNILTKDRSDVATNLSTSMLIDDVARHCGVGVIRTKIGEANVVRAMEENNCRAGGEGNGGVICPAISWGRDGLAGLAIILEEMAKTGQKIYGLASRWPVYYIVKDKIPCEGIDPAGLIRALDERFAGDKKDLTDGLKIIRPEGWVHLRASNTEPIIRCYAEAKSLQAARGLADMVLAAVY